MLIIIKDDYMKEKTIQTYDNNIIYYKHKRFNNKNKPTLVFIHGLSGNHTIWNNVVQYFHKKRYSTIAIDLYGHGKSSTVKQKSRYKLEYFAKDIDCILEKEKINNSIFVGHCLGGMVALIYEKLFPEKAKAFVLIGTTPASFVRYQYSLMRYLPSFFYKLTTTIIGYATTPFSRKNKPYIDFSKLHKHNAFTIVYYDLQTTSLTAYAYTILAMLHYNMKKYLPAINRPTLVIIGEDDKVLLRKSALDLHKNIRSSQLHIMKKTDHLVPMRKSIELAKIIEQFVRTKV